MREMISLITGASSGIGAEFAFQLSEKGYNPILVARRQEKLEKLAKALEKEYLVHPKVLSADLLKEEDLEKVEDYISGLSHLDFLVNSAGFGIPGKFQEVFLTKSLDMLDLHAVVPTRLCHTAIQKMDKGNIINVSSLASLINRPGYTVYSATKSYLTVFSQTLQKDLGENIKVQALCPGFTHTPFHYTKEYKDKSGLQKIPAFLWMDVEEVVKSSLKELGKKRHKVVYIPGFNNRFFLSLMNNKIISPLIWRYYDK